jgi:DNA-binding MarR family transcriptional regulator
MGGTRREEKSDVDSERLGLSVWLRLMKTYNLIFNELRRRVEGEFGCTFPQFDVLTQLARAENGASFVELSRRLLVTSGNLTGIVDRLEREGLVAREQNKTDRRSFRIKLTEKGRALTKTMVPKHARDIDAILDIIPQEDQLQLRELLGRLKQRLEERTGNEG